MSEVWEHCGGRCDIIGCLWENKKQLTSNKCCCTSHREFVPRATGSTDTHISPCFNRYTTKPHEVTYKEHICIYRHTKKKNPYVSSNIFTLSFFFPSMSRIQSTSMIDSSRWEWHTSPNSKRVKGVFSWKAHSMKLLVLPLERKTKFCLSNGILNFVWTWEMKANDIHQRNLTVGLTVIWTNFHSCGCQASHIVSQKDCDSSSIKMALEISRSHGNNDFYL